MTQQPNRGEIVIYRAPDGALILPVKIERESVWLTQNQIAELFGVKKAAISKHISNIVNSHELELNQVVSKMETTAADEKNYLVNYYNLDMIISIGYRVNSIFATQFRQWANKVLKEYITKGYLMP